MNRDCTFLTGSLANLKKQIFAFENNYLEATLAYGNVIKGWEGYQHQLRLLEQTLELYYL